MLQRESSLLNECYVFMFLRSNLFKGRPPPNAKAKRTNSMPAIEILTIEDTSQRKIHFRGIIYLYNE